MTVTFTVPGSPTGKGRPRVTIQGGFARAYTPKGTANYENLVKLMYGQEAKGRKFEDDKPLHVMIVALYEIPKSVSKKKAELMRIGEIRPTKTPDLDNIAKIICDALNKIAYRDDAQVTELGVAKYYSDTPCVIVRITDAMNDLKKIMEATGDDTERNDS